MIAEYLDLIVGVTDNFSDDLYDLVGTLEYIDTLESRISPLRIRVNVHDNQLDSLERQLTRIQALEATDTLTSGTPTGLADQPLQEKVGDDVGIRDPFQSAVRDMAPKESLATSSGGGQTAETGGGFLHISDSQFQRMEEIFGSQSSRRTLLNDNFTFLDAIQSDSNAPMFGVTQRDLQQDLNISTEHLSRATDWDSLLSDVGAKMDLGGPASPSDLTDIDSLDSLDINRADYIDMGKIKRMKWMDSIKDFRVGMTQFYDIFAAFMPMMLTFVGAMPAAIAALGGLATAALGAAAGLAGIAGLGFLGAAMSESEGMPSGEDFREVLSDVPDEFYEAFSGLAQRLEPTFNQGLEGLYTFFDELAARGDALTQLTDDARALGGFLLEFIPNGLQMLALFADAAGPVFTLLAEELGDREILAGLAASLQMTLPYLWQLLNTVLDMLPSIVQFSSGMMMWANVVLKVVTGLGWLLSNLMHLFTFMQVDGNKALGVMVGGLLTFTSVLLIGTQIAGAFISTLQFLRTSTLLANSAVYQGIVAWTAQAGTWISAKLAAMGLTVSVQALTWALRGLLALTGIGLVIAGLGYAFQQTSKKIDQATKSLGDFQDQYNSLDGGGIKAGVQGASGSNVYRNYTDNSNTTINAPDRDTGEELSQYSEYQDWASNESDFSTL